MTTESPIPSRPEAGFSETSKGKSGRRRVACGAALALGLAAGLFYLNHRLGRPDRIEAERRRQELISVRDQVLRYELEHGALPEALEALVPKYLRQDQLESGGTPL